MLTVTNKILIAAAVLVAAGFAALFGGVFRDSSSAAPSETNLS